MRQKRGTNPEVRRSWTRQINGLVFHGDHIADVFGMIIPFPPLWLPRQALLFSCFAGVRLVVSSKKWHLRYLCSIDLRACYLVKSSPLMGADASELGFNLHQAPCTLMVILQHLLCLCIFLHKFLILLFHKMWKCPLMFLLGRQAQHVRINFALPILSR